MNWMSQVTVNPDIIEEPINEATTMADELEAAARRFAQRTDGFAQGKADICNDIAAKLRHFGSFASDKQREFAVKLVAWSKPRTAQAAPAAPAPLTVPKLFAVMQRFAKFVAGSTEIARRNQDSFCWVKYNGACVGKIENGVATLWASKAQAAGTTVAAMTAMLLDIEADPVAKAQEHGRLSGRCSCCGRDLTDPESIEFGIGPVCRGKLMGGF